MDWMEDSFLQLMRSPVWGFHVGNFIDNNCLIFDDEEENKLPYTDVHSKYKIMIEDMLQEYVDDFGISLVQLQEACSSGLAIEHKDLFEYLLAMEDFLLFKSIMVKRNIELNKEAEALLLKHTSKTSIVLSELTSNVASSPGSTDKETTIKQQTMGEKDFEELLHQTMEESLKTYRQETRRREATSEQTQGKEMQESVTNDQQHVMIGETKSEVAIICSQTEHEVNDEKKKAVLSYSMQHKKTTSNSTTDGSQSIPRESHQLKNDPVLKPKSYSGSEAASQWILSAMNEAEQTSHIGDKTEDDISSSRTDTVKEREIYLKKRRNMILEAKQQEREKLLGMYKKNKDSEL